MNRFEYASPETVESAVRLLGPQAVVLAGGTDLISLLKDGVVAPQRVVNIKAIPDLKGIRVESGGLRIGALTTVEELAANPVVQRDYPALAQAAGGIRSPQIQAVGTVGGDLCQRPRCWYFRSGFGLLAMKDGTSLVTAGDNRYHAILGAGPAYFVSPSSFAPPLIAMGARVRIQGPSGAREMALADFFRVPARDSEREHDLGPQDILTDILVPKPVPSSAIYEIREREALDWPLAAAAVVLEMEQSTVKSAQVVLGHVAPKPWVAPAAAAALVGKAVTPATAEAAGAAAVQGAKPLNRNGYKVRLAQVAVKRAVLRAAGMEVA